MYQFFIISDSTLASAEMRALLGNDDALRNSKFEDRTTASGKEVRAEVSASNRFVAWVRKAAEGTRFEVPARALKPGDVRERMTNGDCVARITIPSVHGDVTLVVAPAWAVEGMSGIDAAEDHQMIAARGEERREAVAAVRAAYAANAGVLAEERAQRQLTAG